MMCMRRQAVLTSVLLLLIGSALTHAQAQSRPATRPATLTAEQAARLETLIQQLGHTRFEKREAAETAIRKIGLPALERMNRAIDHPDPEVANRADRIAAFLDMQIPVRADQMTITLTLNEHAIKKIRRLQLLVNITNKTAKPTLVPNMIGYGYDQPGGFLIITGPDGKTIPPEAHGKSSRTRQAPRVLSQYQPYVRSMYIEVHPGSLKRTKAATQPKAAKGTHRCLRLQDRKTIFALPAPGKYTMRVRIDGKDVAAALKKAGGGKVAVPDKFGVVNVQGELAFTGVLESDPVTFEIKK